MRQVLLGGALLLATAALAWAAPPAQKRFVVRYLCFTAASKAGSEIPKERRFDDLRMRERARERLTRALKVDAKEYLEPLRRLAPEYVFAPSIAGQAQLKDGVFVIQDGPVPGDPYGFALRNRLRLTADADLPDRQVLVEQEGQAEWKQVRTWDGKVLGGGRREWSGKSTTILGESKAELVSSLEIQKEGEPPRLIYYFVVTSITAE